MVCHFIQCSQRRLLSYEVIFEQSEPTGTGWGQNIPDRGNSKCKGSEGAMLGMLEEQGAVWSDWSSMGEVGAQEAMRA